MLATSERFDIRRGVCLRTILWEFSRVSPAQCTSFQDTNCHIPTAWRKKIRFNKSVQSGMCSEKNGLVAYYSNRCPFAEYYVNTELPKTAENRKLPLQLIKFETMEQAKSAPSPATIFSLFYNGKFVTTDLSSCMKNRFDKTVKIK